MFSLINKLMGRKSKAVRLAEAVFELLPDEEWASMKFEGDTDTEDVREWIMDLAKDSKCIHSMEKSMDIARTRIEQTKNIDREVARADIYLMFVKELYKHPGNTRTITSYFR